MVVENKEDQSVEFKIDVLSDGNIYIADKEGNRLEEIEDSNELVESMNKEIKKVMMTPLFTYFKTNSGVIFINGRPYRVP